MFIIKTLWGTKILFTYYEYIGYTASLLIAYAFTLKNIIRLRSINLSANILFIIYGYFLNIYPVVFLNTLIAIINIHFLYRFLKKTEVFITLPISNDFSYLQYFLNFYSSDIKNIFSYFNTNKLNDYIGFYILRNTVTAGVFLGFKNDNEFYIVLDYVIPEYRDFKVGEYVFIQQKNFFKNLGCKSFITETASEIHKKYLLKMGFLEISVQNGISRFIKDI